MQIAELYDCVRLSCWITIVVAIYIWLMSFGSTFHLGFFWQGVMKNVSLNQTAKKRVVAHNTKTTTQRQTNLYFCHKI